MSFNQAFFLSIICCLIIPALIHSGGGWKAVVLYFCTCLLGVVITAYFLARGDHPQRGRQNIDH